MMTVSIFDRMEECTDDEVSRMLPLVSRQRREQALRFRHTFGRFACLKAMVMLQDILSERGLTAEGERVVLEYGEYGKPSIVGRPEIHFSISHCQKGIAVAVGEIPVGIDIERFHEADEGLLEKTMSEEERREINSSENPAETFTRLWTRKEAYLKMRGTGIIDDIQEVLRGTEGGETRVNVERGYVWSVYG